MLSVPVINNANCAFVLSSVHMTRPFVNAESFCKVREQQYNGLEEFAQYYKKLPVLFQRRLI